ncbi:hypothetical protein, partial [Mesorhizobium amorphae]
MVERRDLTRRRHGLFARGKSVIPLGNSEIGRRGEDSGQGGEHRDQYVLAAVALLLAVRLRLDALLDELGNVGALRKFRRLLQCVAAQEIAGIAGVFPLPGLRGNADAKALGQFVRAQLIIGCEAVAGSRTVFGCDVFGCDGGRSGNGDGDRSRIGDFARCGFVVDRDGDRVGSFEAACESRKTCRADIGGGDAGPRDQLGRPIVKDALRRATVGLPRNGAAGTPRFGEESTDGLRIRDCVVGIGIRRLGTRLIAAPHRGIDGFVAAGDPHQFEMRDPDV